MPKVHCVHISRSRTVRTELIGAPGSFQKLLEIVIHRLTNILAHINDLLVHTNNHEQQMQILHQLFIQLWQHGLKINLSKSTFCLPEVEYLGFKINQEGVQPGTDQLKAIAATQLPEVKQFLGLRDFFRSHVIYFAKLTGPLTELTKREHAWKNGPLPKPATKAYRENSRQSWYLNLWYTTQMISCPRP